MSEKDKELYRIIESILRRAREKKELTNVEVSNMLKQKGVKISDTSLRRYESGEHAIKIEFLKVLCDFYGLNYNDVMKEAQILRLKSLDPSYKVFSEKDPNPIAKAYGSDTAEVIEIYSKLNTKGKEQALTQLRMIANTPDFIESDKRREGLA
ncbi:MAG: helix-turn-helix transcriptional regulator [Parabacteroides sp.]|nr:helix-turn-helix transcriptional regulator [Parabacteroides sp.]